jgi:polysaccharide biosynthesis transport protein
MNIGFNIPTRIETEPAEHKFDLRTYLNFVWRHWMFIAAVTALALLMALIYLVRATPLYTASTQVLLQQGEKPPGAETGSADSSSFSDRSYIENQLAILASDSLLRRVVIKERLAPPPPAANELQSTDESNNDPMSAEAQSILDGIGSLRDALVVLRTGQSQVLKISITWKDPVRAAKLANAVADAYVVDQLDARLESAKRTSGWLSDRLIELRKQLRDAEEAVTKFRNEHGLGRSGPTVALNDQQLSELNSKLIAARTDAAEKKTRVDFLADVAAGKKSLGSLPDSFQSGSSVIMGTLRTKLADASQREADLLARYNSRHPAVVNVQAEKRDIERSMGAETERIAQTIKSEYALAKARQDAAEQAMRDATGQGGLDNDDAVRLRELERTAAVNKSLFEDFLQKAKISEEQSTFRAREARIIMPAHPPGGPSYPRRGLTFMIALFIGLGLGIGGAIAKEQLNASFTAPRQVEELLGVPVLASVRRLEKKDLIKDGKPIKLPAYSVHHPLSPFSEALRTLRSGIHMSDVDDPPKVIAVTSSRPGEGKTTVALSVAMSAAFSGLKVAIVDADLRRPAATTYFGLERQKGLVDLLMGEATSKEAIFKRELELTVIPAGSKSLNPPDVLSSERMRALVSSLKEQFDYVVIDAPPVGPVVDAVIVAGLVDKFIFVVEWGSTPRDLVVRSLQQLANQKRRVGGIVLNSVHQKRAKKFGGEYYYGASYDKYYTQ